MIMYKMKPEIENDSQRMIDYPQEKENENGVVSRETDAQHAQVSVNVKEVKYKLNMKAALAKKLASCSKIPYEIENQATCSVVTFNTATFELFMKEVVKYIEENPFYASQGSTLKDLNVIPQDIVRVRKKQDVDMAFEKLPHLFTINIYRTKCSIMVNGDAFKQFIDYDLPVVIDRIDVGEDMLATANEQIRVNILNAPEYRAKSKESSKFDTLALDSGASASNPNVSDVENVAGKRSRKKRAFDDYDVIDI